MHKPLAQWQKEWKEQQEKLTAEQEPERKPTTS